MITSIQHQLVRLTSSCAPTKHVLLLIMCVMASLTVLMALMKTKNSVPRVPSSSSAQMAGVQTWKMCVTGGISVGITAMKTKYVNLVGTHALSCSYMSAYNIQNFQL